MPADDGLHGMPAEDLAAFLHSLRALREREGLSLDGADLPPGRGPRRGRWRPGAGLVGVTAVALALAGLAAGGAVLTDPAGHSQTSAPGALLPGGGRSMADHGGQMHMRIRPVAPAQPKPRPARSSPAPRMPAKRRVRVVVPVLVRPARMGTEVAGPGCPGSENDGVSLAAASTGPGWATAGGGWTGNGCDGSSVWTMDPDGTSPSTLSWFFYPSMRASACQLAVFVPSQNALGVGSYQVSAGPASLGTVSVDQAGSAGQWVTLGSYPAAGGMLTVQLQPGTATLTAAAGGNGDSGNGSSGNGGNGDSGSNGHGGGGKGGSGGSGHHTAVAASAARASCS